MDGTQRRARLARSRLYLVLEARPHGADPSELLDAALRGGVDVVQLRDKELPDDELVRASEPFRRACDAHGALFVLNDRPDLVERTGADGVHVGQQDRPAEARRLVGGERLVGLSATIADELHGDADYFGVGAIFATPTKPESPAGELELVRAARNALRVPWFAIGGIDAKTVESVAASGAYGVAVVRAVRDAADPEAAARALRAVLPPTEATVTDRNVLLPEVEWIRGKGGGAAPHTHSAHADVFYVLEGEMEFRAGDGTVRLPTGSCLGAAPLLVHGFRTPPEGRTLYLNLHAPGIWARGRRAGLPPEECDQFGVDRASPEARPIVSAPGDGDRLIGRHRVALVKVQRPEVDVLEYLVEPGYGGADEHVHLRHADCFHVLEGELDFRLEGGAVRVEAGTSVVVPPGVPHAFAGVGRARFLNVHAPSCGFVAYLRRLDAGEDFDRTSYDVYELA